MQALLPEGCLHGNAQGVVPSQKHQASSVNSMSKNTEKEASWHPGWKLDMRLALSMSKALDPIHKPSHPNTWAGVSRPHHTAVIRFGFETFSSELQGLENGDAESSGVGPIFEELTSHLTNEDSAFMKLWLQAIALEEEGLVSRRANMWNMPGKHLNAFFAYAYCF